MQKRLLIILSLYSTLALANVEGDLQNFFEGLGFAHNLSRPRSFQDQQGGYYSGGSLLVRGNVENATLFEVNPPNVSFGCNAIDLYGGAFSFINKEQFLALMNNIGKQAVSFGVSIALQTAAPQIKSVLDQLMGTVQDMNALNINSCQASASLLGGLLPKTQASSSVLCESIGISNNTFGDYAAARQGCGMDKQSARINSAKGEAFKDILGDEYNLAWKALNTSALFSEDRKLAELFMSISGSVITRKKAEQQYSARDRRLLRHGGVPQQSGSQQYLPEYLSSLAKSDDLISALVNGGTAMVYQCDRTGSDECLAPQSVELRLPKESALLYKVQSYITSLSQKIVTDSAITETEKAFVNATYFPILKIIAVESAFKEGNAPISADEIAEIVAYDIVLRYLSRVMDLTAVAVGKLQAIQLTKGPFKAFFEGIHQARKVIYQKRHGLFAQLNASLALMERTTQIEKQLHDLFMQEENL